MFKHPAINAILASTYIVVIVSIMTRFDGKEPDGILAPILFLSLLTLSAAVMGSLFFLQPVLMYLDGKKKEAINYFVQTLGIFALITVIILITVLSGKTF